MSTVHTANVVIERSPAEVFAYVSRAENQPAWAVNFVRSTRPIGGGRYVMETPFGEMTYRVEANSAAGTVDFVFETTAGESVLPARAAPHRQGTLFMFSIERQHGMPDDAWDAGKRGLDEELEALRAILEGGASD